MTVIAQVTAFTVNKFTWIAYSKLTNEKNLVSDNEKYPRNFLEFCVHMFIFAEGVETFWDNKRYLLEFCAHLLARLEHFIKNE